MVYGDGIDQVMLYGRGAGKFPTASAVVGDIIDAAVMDGTSVSQTWEDSADSSFIADYREDTVSFYVRTSGTSQAKISSAFGTVEYLSRENQPASELAFITPAMAEKDFDEKLKALDGDILGKIRVFDVEE